MSKRSTIKNHPDTTCLFLHFYSEINLLYILGLQYWYNRNVLVHEKQQFYNKKKEFE